MTHLLSRRVLLGTLLGGASVALTGCDDSDFSGDFSLSGGSQQREGLPLARQNGAIQSAIARLSEQAGAPGTSDDLRDRMNTMIALLVAQRTTIANALDPALQWHVTNRLLGDAADLMIEAGNLRIKQLYDRPPAEGGGSWIAAWWDYSSP